MAINDWAYQMEKKRLTALDSRDALNYATACLELGISQGSVEDLVLYTNGVELLEENLKRRKFDRLVRENVVDFVALSSCRIFGD